MMKTWVMVKWRVGKEDKRAIKVRRILRGQRGEGGVETRKVKGEGN